MTTSKYKNSMNVLRKVRRDLGLTQEDLARKVGVNQSVISRIESGDIDLSSRVRNSLENIFGEPVLKAAESQVSVNGVDGRLGDLHRLLERYIDVISDSGIRAIATYVEHIVALSDSGIENHRPVSMGELWGKNWSWGPRELEQYISQSAAPVMTWNRISIQRSYPVKVNGERVMKGEIYVDGYRSTESPLFSFLLDQVKNPGIYNGRDLKIDIDSSVISDYFRNFILVSKQLSPGYERTVSVLMSGESAYSFNDFEYLNDIVDDFLQSYSDANL